MVSKQFILAGKALFTVEVPASFRETHPDVKEHYAYRVQYAPPRADFPENYFVGLIVNKGGKNIYRYLGTLDTTSGLLEMTPNSRFAEDAWPVRIVRRVLQRIWAGEQDQIAVAGWDLHNDGRCARCGSRLKASASLALGIGPECRKQLAG